MEESERFLAELRRTPPLPVDGGEPNNALAALEEAFGAAGAIPPASNQVPPNTPTVSLGLWRRYYYQRSPASNAEARKKAFLRARMTLQAQHIGVWGTEDGAEEDAQCWLLRRRQKAKHEA